MKPVKAIGKSATAAASMSGMSIAIAASGTGMPSPKIIAGTPRTRPMLKILLPTIFPTAISVSPLRSATIEVASSGRDVPMATTVSPITRLLTPNAVAMLTAPVTKSCAPRTSKPIPARSKSAASHKGTGLVLKGSEFSSRLGALASFFPKTMLMTA